MSGLFDLVSEWKARLATEGPAKNATNPALIESAMKNPDYGLSSATPGYVSPTAKTGQQLMALGQQIGGSFGEEQMPEIDKLAVMDAANWNRQQQAEGQQIALSSKRAKTPGGSGLALARGMRNENPIDANGAQIAAIQELKKQVDDLKARIARAKTKRGARKGN